MKEIVVISGKGGTGKTSLAASLAFLSGKESVIADCDVDAADMHLLLAPDFRYKEDFYSGQLAAIDNEICTSCGLCMEKCRFNAIETDNEVYNIKEQECEGCGYCERICPVNAISMKDQCAGQFYISDTRIDNILVHAKLNAGAENSGKLVAKVKKEARKIAGEKKGEYVIADGSPGIGCPVISSLSGADFVIIVTEPSVSGIHDMKRVFELVRKFNIQASCLINKYDLNPDITSLIMDYMKSESIMHLGNIPYTSAFTDAMTRGLTVLENGHPDIAGIIEEAWGKVKQKIND